MEAHPITKIFPAMSAETFAALKADIAEHGLREPITLFQGSVIDGTHRLRACEELGIKPATRSWDGEEADLLAYVVSLNLHRRHLNESQRAMVSAKITKRKPGQSFGGAPPPIGVGVSQAEIAKLLNIGTTSIDRARVVRDRGIPELVTKVEQGEISVSRASEIAKLPKAEQTKMLQSPATLGMKPGYKRSPERDPNACVNRTVDALEVHVDALALWWDRVNREHYTGRLREVRAKLSRYINNGRDV